MTPTIIVQGAKKGLAAVVAAALILAAPGPGCYEAWAAAQKETGEIPALGGGLAAPVNPAAVPVLPGNDGVSAGIPTLPDSNVAGAAAPAGSNGTSIASPARKVAARSAATSIPDSKSSAKAPADAARQPSAANAAGELLKNSGPSAASASSPAQSPDLDSIQSSAGRLFDNSSSRRPPASPASRIAPEVKAAAVIVPALAAAAQPTIRAAVGHAVQSSAQRLGLGGLASSVVQSGLPWWSSLGNVVGNFLGFYFSVPQIYQTFKDGNATSTPAGRAALLIVASLLLGGVNAVVAHSMFWGVQNLFGAVSMGAVFPIAKILKGKSLSSGKAKLATAAVVGGLLAASVGLFFIASASMPGVIAAALPTTIGGTQLLLRGLTTVVGAILAAFVMKKALARRDSKGRGPDSMRPKMRKALLVSLAACLAVGGLLPALPAFLTTLIFPMTAAQLTVAIQAVTSALFLSLFAPDIVSLLKKKIPESFTPAFSLSFFISSLGFIAWMKGELAQTPPHTPAWVRWQIYLAVNVVYAVVSGISYFAARKEARARAKGQKPGDEEPPAPPPPGHSPRINLIKNGIPQAPAPIRRSPHINLIRNGTPKAPKAAPQAPPPAGADRS